MNLASLVAGALAQGRDLVSQTGVTYRRVTSEHYDEVAGRYANLSTTDTFCERAVVVPFGGSSADKLVDRTKLRDHTRKVLVARADLGETLVSPDDLVLWDGFEWAIVSFSEIGGLVTMVVTR